MRPDGTKTDVVPSITLFHLSGNDGVSMCRDSKPTFASTIDLKRIVCVNFSEFDWVRYESLLHFRRDAGSFILYWIFMNPTREEVLHDCSEALLHP